ncbi:MAG: hypothetical protein ACRD3D_00990 [Terriglobia bacterium]
MPNTVSSSTTDRLDAAVIVAAAAIYSGGKALTIEDAVSQALQIAKVVCRL